MAAADAQTTTLIVTQARKQNISPHRLRFAQRGWANNNNNNNNKRISIMLQRFNSVLLHDTLPVDLPDL